MEPLHAIEYELTTEMAADIQRALMPWELRRGWRRELPVFAGALVFAALIIWVYAHQPQSQQDQIRAPAAGDRESPA